MSPKLDSQSPPSEPDVELEELDEEDERRPEFDTSDTYTSKLVSGIDSGLKGTGAELEAEPVPVSCRFILLSFQLPRRQWNTVSVWH